MKSAIRITSGVVAGWIVILAQWQWWGYWWTDVIASWSPPASLAWWSVYTAITSAVAGLFFFNPVVTEDWNA